MAIQPWSSWLPDLSPHLPLCPPVVTRHELKRAAQEFFEKTRAWIVTTDPETIDAGTEEFAITPDAEQEIVRVEQVWYGGTLLTASTGAALSKRCMDNWHLHVGTPSEYIQESPGAIRFYPVPVGADSVVIRMAVKPSEASKGIPDDMAGKYRTILICGAKSRLMLFPGKPWTNPELGMKNDADFKLAIDKTAAAITSASGNSRISSSPRWC